MTIMYNGTMSLLDWIESLFRDPAARAAFAADPQGYADRHGFDNLSSADVHDALCLAADNRSAGYDHDRNRAWRDDRDERDERDGHEAEHHVQLPPPPAHYEHDADGAHYLHNYITNNYTTINEHNTWVDDSIHQRVDTHGGDFSQDIHNDPVIASGDHAVASGGDIRDSPITTGEDNVIGEHNQAVTGDHNTTAFGSGSATNARLDHANFGDGAGVSFGADAHGSNTHSDTTTQVHNSGDGSTSVNAAGDHAAATEYTDQHQADTSRHSAYDDYSHTDGHNDYNSHNDARLDDSHNLDIHHA
jgi:hypothetical protein